MMTQSYIHRPNRMMLEKLPKWLPVAVALYVLTAVLNSIAGTGDARLAFTVTTSIVWYSAICFNLCLVGAGLFSLLKALVAAWETWNEAKTFIDRVWKIAMHGPASAGLVGEDLGQADKHGVYIRKTRTGPRLFLRMTRGSMSGNSGSKIWQWSLDKRSWTTTAKADQYWNGNHSISGMADKILIRRLEVESAFREKQPFLNPIAQPPAIEMEIANPQDKERLVKLAPRSFLCPISMELMTEPVVCPSGVTYDRKSITRWIQEHHSDPATQASLRNDNLYPNLTLRDMIQEWLVENKFITTCGNT
eukprot:g2504.t1